MDTKYYDRIVIDGQEAYVPQFVPDEGWQLMERTVSLKSGKRVSYVDENGDKQNEMNLIITLKEWEPARKVLKKNRNTLMLTS